MGILSEQVSDILTNEYELEFEYDKQDNFFRFSVSMDHVDLDVIILCCENEKKILLFVIAPIQIPKKLFDPTLRLIIKIQIEHNATYSSLFINEANWQLMSRGVLNIAVDLRVNKELFYMALISSLHLMDDNFFEFIQIVYNKKRSYWRRWYEIFTNCSRNRCK